MARRDNRGLARSTGPLTEQALLAHIDSLPHGRANFKQLVRELGIKGGGRGDLDELLTGLVDRGDLIELRGGSYVVTARSREFVLGRLSMHRDGYGFVVPERPIDRCRATCSSLPRRRSEAMHGDRVLARILRIEENGRGDGEIVRILRRAHMTVVGEFTIKRAWLLCEAARRTHPAVDRDRRRHGDSRLPARPSTAWEWSRRSINVGGRPRRDDRQRRDSRLPRQTARTPSGRVIEVLGSPDDFGVDVEIIIRKFHIPHRFPAEFCNRRRAIPSPFPPTRSHSGGTSADLDIVTIDGETARDFDDAVWVDRLPNGNYALHVHIADVSYYVRPGTPDRPRGGAARHAACTSPIAPCRCCRWSFPPTSARSSRRWTGWCCRRCWRSTTKGDVVSQEFTRGVIRQRRADDVHQCVGGSRRRRGHPRAVRAACAALRADAGARADSQPQARAARLDRLRPARADHRVRHGRRR